MAVKMELGHIGLSVESLSRSAAFYRKYFGLECAGRFSHPESGLKIAFLKKDSVILELFEFKRHKPLPAYRRELASDLRTIGVKHFALLVDDIEGVYRKLKRSGVVFASQMQVFDDGYLYFFIKDPDGNLVEISEAR